MLGFHADKDQAAILRDIAGGVERGITIRSGHGVGKTTTLAIAIVWHNCTRFPQKTVCTAPTSSQLFDALASETKAWFKKLPPAFWGEQPVFEIKTDAIVFTAAPDESFTTFATSRAETPEALAGKHSENVLLIIDEASGVPEAVFEAAAGSMSGHNAVTVMAGNPVRTTGTFFESFRLGKWKRYHISCVNHPRVSPDFVAEIAARYGLESNAYRVRVLGEFPKGDDDTVIPFELVEAALTRDVKPHLVKPIWGVDCGRFGNDPSALAERIGNTLPEPIELFKGLDTMQLVGRIKAKWDARPVALRPSVICVDVIGIGSGVVDRLSELGLPVRGINVSESPSLKGEYTNLRAELWFKGREWFEKRDVKIVDQELLTELVAPKYSFMSSGKKLVESKADMKKRLPKLGSPNRADAFLLTLAEDAVSAAAASRLSWKAPLRRTIKGIV